MNHRSTINFDWGLGAPASWMGWGWGARWTGYVEPTANEEYTFYTQSDDGVRLWVNGHLIIDDWRDHGLEEHSGRIRLEAGKQYRIKLEYYDKIGTAICRLLWSSPRNGKQIVPASQLYH